MNLPRASLVSFVLCVAGSATLVLGCYATVSPQPVQTTSADDVVYGEPPPPQIETYPVVVYEGTPHYYVEGQWYLHNRRGWGHYRKEPAHLAQRRPPPRQHQEERRQAPRQEDHHDERHEERR